MWIEEGHPVPDDVFSNYVWTRRPAATHAETSNGTPVTESLSQEEVGDAGPIRILLTGNGPFTSSESENENFL